ncbi:TadE family protein [Micromonospora sp. WMMD1082]|uniref:TadE/TadG family type IV pilus assembly protein n=1 Tax=Micromonospora sp. WMMD1082 TaxID=3016104 RepID=UPI00241708EE|nr:TadE family protein [Micromonospora sp. WMMD1082]MDG4794932.1 pilus assembly protein [Micromonospora sp. WMMD1082]
MAAAARHHRRHAPDGRARSPDDRERGGNPVELAVALPAILLMLFASVQVAAVFMARSTALNAAQIGVNAQRLHQAPVGAGAERATTFLHQAGDWLVDWNDPGPSCVATATDPPGEPVGVTCTVTGRSLSVVPGVSFSVRQTAHGTVERWTAP